MNGRKTKMKVKSVSLEVMKWPRINTFCMKVMVDMKDYQLVVKNEGAKDVPPFSSPVLPGSSPKGGHSGFFPPMAGV